MTYCKAKVKTMDINRKHFGQMFPYAESATGFTVTKFYWTCYLQEDTKLKENSTQNQSLKWIMRFLQLYKYLMNNSFYSHFSGVYNKFPYFLLLLSNISTCVKIRTIIHLREQYRIYNGGLRNDAVLKCI